MLGLQTKGAEALKLNTFGGDRFSKKRCDLVQLSLQGNDGDVEISAACFPKICSSIPTWILSGPIICGLIFLMSFQ